MTFESGKKTRTTVTVWNENIHEREDESIAARYPDGIHGAIASIFESDDYEVETTTLQQEEQGVPQSLLDTTDVLIWWEHVAHDDISDDTVHRISERVHDGMGIIFLHSAKDSPIFSSLLGTTGDSKWDNNGSREKLWVVNPSHPIANGLDECIEIPNAATYCEPFDIPKPDSQVFASGFEEGEVFRSGVCFRRGAGKIFYFRPGDEEYPIYHHDGVRQILRNAVDWATPTDSPEASGDTPSRQSKSDVTSHR